MPEKKRKAGEYKICNKTSEVAKHGRDLIKAVAPSEVKKKKKNDRTKQNKTLGEDSRSKTKHMEMKLTRH